MNKSKNNEANHRCRWPKAARDVLEKVNYCHICGKIAVTKFRKHWWCRDCMIAEDSEEEIELQTHTRSMIADAEIWRPF